QVAGHEVVPDEAAGAGSNDGPGRGGHGVLAEAVQVVAVGDRAEELVEVFPLRGQFGGQRGVARLAGPGRPVVDRLDLNVRDDRGVHVRGGNGCHQATVLQRVQGRPAPQRFGPRPPRPAAQALAKTVQRIEDAHDHSFPSRYGSLGSRCWRRPVTEPGPPLLAPMPSALPYCNCWSDRTEKIKIVVSG